MKFKNILVSRFSNYKSTTPETITLQQWIDDKSQMHLVEYIRNNPNPEERKLVKAKLPAITLGVFKRRKASELVNHSGFICIDIDSGDNPEISDFKKLRNDLKNIVNVAYSSLSVSGNGVFCFIPIKYPDKHKEHFEALKKVFEKLGIVLDKACGDITRLRGYSYDEDAYKNENATPFELLIERMVYEKKIISKKAKGPVVKTSSQNSNRSRVLRVITQLAKRNIDITESYEKWFQIGCALAHEFGEEGRELYHLVSENHHGYNPDETDTKFTECVSNPYGYTIGTFFHYASESGIK